MIRVPLQSERPLLTVVSATIVSIFGYPQDGRTQEPGEQKNHITPDAKFGVSGIRGLGTWVRKRILIVFTISVMSGLKAAEIFFD